MLLSLGNGLSIQVRDDLSQVLELWLILLLENGLG